MWSWTPAQPAILWRLDPYDENCPWAMASTWPGCFFFFLRCVILCFSVCDFVFGVFVPILLFCFVLFVWCFVALFLMFVVIVWCFPLFCFLYFVVVFMRLGHFCFCVTVSKLFVVLFCLLCLVFTFSKDFTCSPFRVYD